MFFSDEYSDQCIAKSTTVPFRYVIKVTGLTDDLVKEDTVPLALCTPNPPKREALAFLVEMVKKYESDIKRAKPNDGKCWNCPKAAISYVHTPMSYLHQHGQVEGAMIVDLVQPVCVTGGQCEQEARKMIAEQLPPVGL